MAAIARAVCGTGEAVGRAPIRGGQAGIGGCAGVQQAAAGWQREWGDRSDGQAQDRYVRGRSLRGILPATTHAAAAIAQEMKNAVHGIRVVGPAMIAGPQTSSVNSVNMPASAIAAIRGRIENTTPSPAAI